MGAPLREGRLFRAINNGDSCSDLRKGVKFVKTWMEQHCKLYFAEDKLGTALADFSKFMAERSGENAGSKQLFLGQI